VSIALHRSGYRTRFDQKASDESLPNPVAHPKLNPRCKPAPLGDSSEIVPVPKHMDAGSCGPAGLVPGKIDGLCSLFAELAGRHRVP
jgi:hypothetical protein